MPQTGPVNQQVPAVQPTNNCLPEGCLIRDAIIVSALIAILAVGAWYFNHFPVNGPAYLGGLLTAMCAGGALILATSGGAYLKYLSSKVATVTPQLNTTSDRAATPPPAVGNSIPEQPASDTAPLSVNAEGTQAPVLPAEDSKAGSASGSDSPDLDPAAPSPAPGSVGGSPATHAQTAEVIPSVALLPAGKNADGSYLHVQPDGSGGTPPEEDPAKAKGAAAEPTPPPPPPASPKNDAAGKTAEPPAADANADKPATPPTSPPHSRAATPKPDEQAHDAKADADELGKGDKVGTMRSIAPPEPLVDLPAKPEGVVHPPLPPKPATGAEAPAANAAQNVAKDPEPSAAPASPAKAAAAADPKSPEPAEGTAAAAAAAVASPSKEAQIAADLQKEMDALTPIYEAVKTPEELNREVTKKYKSGIAELTSIQQTALAIIILQSNRKENFLSSLKTIHPKMNMQAFNLAVNDKGEGIIFQSMSTQPDAVAYLLAANRFVNASKANNVGQTPLMQSVNLNLDKVFNALLDRMDRRARPDFVNVKDQDGDTALDFAVLNYQGQADKAPMVAMITKLVKNGAIEVNPANIDFIKSDATLRDLLKDLLAVKAAAPAATKK